MSVQAMMLSRELKEDVALLQQLETESVGKVMDMAVLQVCCTVCFDLLLWNINRQLFSTM